jgi:PPOX class probable F420-dependent enzyme
MHTASLADKAGMISGKEGYMTTQSPEHQGETKDPLASLSPYEFVLLTTFRTSGLGVPTAMWFAHEHGKLYMVTGRTTGKLKRIRTTSRVLLAPCDWMGNVLGPQIEAYARELPVAEHAHADAVLAQKYGEQYEMDSSEAENAEEETFIELVRTPHHLRGELA